MKTGQWIAQLGVPRSIIMNHDTRFSMLSIHANAWLKVLSAMITSRKYVPWLAMNLYPTITKSHLSNSGTHYSSSFIPWLIPQIIIILREIDEPTHTAAAIISKLQCFHATIIPVPLIDESARVSTLFLAELNRVIRWLNRKSTTQQH